MITITTTSGNDLAMVIINNNIVIIIIIIKVLIKLQTTKQLIQQAHKEKISKASLVASHKNLLDGPARPSFCSLNDTLPVFLDGCMIQVHYLEFFIRKKRKILTHLRILQNNKIYVGRDYVRDLTPEETQELKDYIMKKREFQKYLAATINQVNYILLFI